MVPAPRDCSPDLLSVMRDQVKLGHSALPANLQQQLAEHLLQHCWPPLQLYWTCRPAQAAVPVLLSTLLASLPPLNPRP